jgi:hypothetical protein
MDGWKSSIEGLKLSEPHPLPLKSWGKSVLVGGSAAGILSILPFVNLLNLFFMFWIVAGATLTVHLLLRQNREIRISDSVISGAMSGLIAGIIFAALTLISFLQINQEKFAELVEKARTLYPGMDPEAASLLQSGHFKIILVIIVSVFVILSIAAGSIAGMIARFVFLRSTGKSNG